MPLGIGEYPPEFNAKVHGPYNPATYYGKPDTALAQTKLGELPKWLGRRNYHPLAMVRCVSRGYWRWAQTWLLPRRASPACLAQFCMASCAVWYMSMYSNIKYHRHVKYHW